MTRLACAAHLPPRVSIRCKRHAWLAICGLAAFIVVFCGNFVDRAWAQDDAVRVVVTTKPVHSIVTQVMAGIAQPQLLVDGSASSHTFSLRPSAARDIAAGGMLFRVSEATEPFTRKLVEGLPDTVTVVTLADPKTGVKLLPQRPSGAFEAHSHDEHGHDGEGHKDLQGGGTAGEQDAYIDGHIWLDPENAKAIAIAAGQALSQKWPAHASAFTANAARTVANIDAVSREIVETLASVRDMKFVVFHDAYQYFESRFGVHAAAAITLSPDHPPSAKRLTDVREQIRTSKAACIFTEPGFQPKLLAAVAEDLPVRTGSLDPEGQALTAGRDLYGELLRSLARNLKSCLAG